MGTTKIEGTLLIEFSNLELSTSDLKEFFLVSKT